MRSSVDIRRMIFGVVVVCVFGTAAFGQPWAGSGTAEDPYQIWDACDMQAIGADANYWDANFILCADINLGEYTGTSFNIIGTVGNPFTGVFDGNEHTISNFTYDYNGVDRIGLFGYVDDPNAEIKNLELIEPNVNAGSVYGVGALVGELPEGVIINCGAEGGRVSGGQFVGGLVGINSGEISNCYSTASVIATGNTVGGLAGRNWSGTISNSYATGSVLGDSEVGGLVGDLIGGIAGTISNSYSSGSVSGNDDVGGLVGNNAGRIYNSFWDVQTSGQVNMCGEDLMQRCDDLNGKTTSEMKTAITFGVWLCGEPVWTINEGVDYPRLWWQDLPGELITGSLLFGGGNGGPNDPFLIETAEQLNTVGLIECEWDKHFKLIADVDLSDFNGLNGNPAFNIVGFTRHPFTGVFDGNGHTISNFGNNNEKLHYVWGLFGEVDSPNAEIKSLGLIDPYVGDTEVPCGDGPLGSLIGYLKQGTITACYAKGGYISQVFYANYTGGLIGENGGTILNCYVYATDINKSSQSAYEIGGLAGINSGTISNCYVYATDINSSYSGNTGGLVGENFGSGTISSCYAAENVIMGGSDVGGLVGDNDGTISNCHSDCLIEGGDDVGGLVGANGGDIYNCYSVGICYYAGGLVGAGGGTVTNSFWDVNSSGQTYSAGGTGLTTEEMQTKSTFIDAGWDFATPVWTIDDGVDYPRLSWEEVIITGRYGGGRGLPKVPYLVYTAEDMQAIGANLIDWNKHFRLMADIDLSGFEPNAFNIIGGEYDGSGSGDLANMPFIGVFDGDGHIISNFTYISDGIKQVGLFSYTKNALIKDLGLIDPNVNATDAWQVGALAGFIDKGGVSGCYVEGGNVYGGQIDAGGLVGLTVGGVVANCYSSASVFGEGDYAGGLVGRTFGDGTEWPLPKITNCYSVGSVTGGSTVGGLIGYDYGGVYTSCFWDVNVNPDMNGIGNANDPNVIGKTTAEMQTASTFTDAGWDFVGETINGPNDIWDICEGTNYPKFVWQKRVADFVCPDGVNFVDYAFFAEYWLQAIYGDCDGVELTGDGKVNWVDFDVFAEYWGQSGCGECGGADFTGEGDVDLADLDVFSEHWLQTEYAEVDLTEDGQVGLDDLGQFAENWLRGL